MRNSKIVMSALLLLVVLVVTVGIVSAAPPPPVPQQLGRVDTQFPNVPVTDCRGCHGGQYALKPDGNQTHPAKDIHHFMIGKKTTTLGCYDCHPNELGPDGKYYMYVEDEQHDGSCISCHNGTAWDKNSFINMTVIRGQPGRPHHNTTKNSASNLAVPAAYMAADRNCKACHGDGLLDNYNDGHPLKNLEPQLVSVFADFKINATQNEADTGVPGVEWGGCAACHDVAAANPIIFNNHDTHHYETTSMLGRQCNYCHVASGFRAEPIPDYSPDPSANVLRIWFNDTTGPYYDFASIFNWDTSIRHIEVSNNAMLNAGDAVNGTGCLKCHSYRDLHNIEASGPNPSAQYNIDNRIPGYGHIGNDTDCNGCHAGWSASAPYVPEGPLSTGLDSVVPGNMVAGADVDVTLTGSNLKQDPTYTTTVLLDGQPVTVKSVTNTEVVATVPGTTTVGAHSIQVAVGGIAGPLSTLLVAAPVTITSATLTSGVITITGTGFGTDAQQMVTINKAGGMTGSDSITSWTDTQVVAASAAAAIGDTVTVSTPYGAATATITTGTVPPSITVVTPNGGENWRRGTTQAITWNNVGTPGDTVNIVAKNINSKGKTVTTTIATGVTNSGSYSWNIPRTQAIDNDYKVTVTTSGGYTDTSDANFQISR